MKKGVISVRARSHLPASPHRRNRFGSTISECSQVDNQGSSRGDACSVGYSTACKQTPQRPSLGGLPARSFLKGCDIHHMTFAIEMGAQFDGRSRRAKSEGDLVACHCMRGCAIHVRGKLATAVKDDLLVEREVLTLAGRAMCQQLQCRRLARTCIGVDLQRLPGCEGFHCLLLLGRRRE